MEAELAGLAGAKKLAGAAKLEVGFGDSKPSVVRTIVSRRARASSVMRPGATRMQWDCCAPRPMRREAGAVGRGRSVPRAQ